MLPLGPDEFMERLLAAHAAEDAWQPPPEPVEPMPGLAPTDPEPIPDVLGSDSIDESPVLGLLGQAERLCGVDLARLHGAAAA